MATSSSIPDFDPRAANFDPQDLLEQLDPEQRQVARQLMGPLVVRAGAGTGKTRAITYRIAYGVHSGAYDPSSVLALTYTTRAAAEMVQRLHLLHANGVQARTFHSAALRQLRYFWPDTVGGQLPRLMEQKASMVRTAAQRLGVLGDVRRSRELVRDLAAEVEWAKVSLLDGEAYLTAAPAADRTPVGDLSFNQVADLISVYEDVKDEAHCIDFEDVLILMAALLREREDVARAVRSQYRHFVVDEFQDVSALQFELLSQWLGERHEVCVVGDVAQTIYSFAGADATYLTKFHRAHPGAREIELNRDYRSTPQIVSVANHALMQRPRPGQAPVLPPGAVHLVSQRESGPAVQFAAYADDAAEVAAVVAQVKQLLAAGGRAREIAILVRTNAQTEPFETALREASIAVAVQGQKPFFQREDVLVAIRTLRLATRLRGTNNAAGGGSAGGGQASAPAPTTPAASDGQVNAPASTAPATSDGQASGDPAQVLELIEDMLAGLGWSQQPPSGPGGMREKWEALDVLVRLARQQQPASLTAFIENLDRRAAIGAQPREEAVTVASLHSAKGLEWDSVFLAGVSEGLLPISYAKTPAMVDEERRLLYVGITRARTRLWISYAKARTGGRSRGREMSRFLAPLWPDSHEDGSAHRGFGSRLKQRAAVAENFDSDTTELWEALKRWRTQVARERQVRAYMVFTDQVLANIAHARPATFVQLRQVNGVGEMKLSQYGKDVLAVVAKHQS